MAINIGRTGTSGRFIGGGAGVYRSTQMKFYVDPFKYACWTGESDSSMVDLSGWGNDVTVVNGATTRTNGWWSFDGTDDFAKRALDSDFSFGTSTDFTIQMWYSNQGGTGYDFGLIQQGPFSGGKGATVDGWNLWYDTSNNKMFLKMGASSLHSDDTDTTGTTWNGGQWINIAVVADRSSNTKFYKNGILSSTYNSSSTSYSATATSSQFIIGGTQTTVASSTAVSNDFNGYMGQIQIYAEALSHDEIRQNFNANRGIYGV
jgi:hypothetical protein